MDNADADATREWLDGLAGRAGTGAAHDDGVRVRTALAPEAQDAPVVTWRDVEAMAGAGTAADATATPVGLPRNEGRAEADAAANDPRPWRRFGWAAALVLGVGLVTLMAPPAPTPEPALRGVGGPVSQGAQWLVDQPLEAAEALATELRSLQAEVTVTREGEAAILVIQARPGAVDAVNARLAKLETGLDAEGHLQLTVRPSQ